MTRRLFAAAFVLFLYLAGVGHWCAFWNWGTMRFLRWPEKLGGYDFDKEYDHYTILRTALVERQMPWVLHESYNHTHLFLGVPDTVLSPQILLLPFMSLGMFMLVQTVLLYSVGFLGLVALRHRYRLSPIPFTLLFLLFNFNGFITSHLHVGHTMWIGYFLFSWVALFVLRLVEEPESPKPALLLALTLFGMMMQGAFHMVIWVWLFLLFFFAFQWRQWRQAVLIFGFSVGLSAYRVLPGVVAFSGTRARSFWAGYPSVKDVLDGLITLRGPEFGWIVANPLYQHPLAWWEFDMYIGVLGLGMVVWYGVWLARRPALGGCRYQPLDKPMIVLAFLSLSYFYSFVADQPVPLFNAEGVSSRFLIVPLVLLMTIAAVRMQRQWDLEPPGLTVQLFWVAVALETAFTLLTHSHLWRVVPGPPGSQRFPFWKPTPIPSPEGTIHAPYPYEDEGTVGNSIDPAAQPPLEYVVSVYGSAILSLIVLALWAWFCWKAWRKSPILSTT